MLNLGLLFSKVGAVVTDTSRYTELAGKSHDHHRKTWKQQVVNPRHLTLGSSSELTLSILPVASHHSSTQLKALPSLAP
jgi:hypothetical protein